MSGIYSLDERPGYLRLYAHPNVMANRGRAALMGVRQQESDFEYSARMAFAPRQDNVEAGVSLFQKDNNYLNFTVVRRGDENVLRLVLAEAGVQPRTVEERVLGEYDGEIVFRVVSKDSRYRYEYSLDRGNRFAGFAETDAARLLSRVYTGAYLGVYSSGNGEDSGEHADFDWGAIQGLREALDDEQVSHDPDANARKVGAPCRGDVDRLDPDDRIRAGIRQRTAEYRLHHHRRHELGAHGRLRQR